MDGIIPWKEDSTKQLMYFNSINVSQECITKNLSIILVAEKKGLDT